MKPRTIAAITLPLLFCGVYAVSNEVEPLAASLEPGPDVLTVSDARLIKKMTLGYDGLAADIYWTRVVQYYGDKRHAQNDNAGEAANHFPLLEPLLNITTLLDPHLLVAYKVGAVFLAEPAPKGAGRPDLAAKLLRLGIANNPDEWRLWHDLGMVYYEDMHDYPSAAAAYREGSKNPHARMWMKVMAAKIAQEGNSTEISCFMWTEVFNSSEDPNIRKNALDHLKQLACK